MLCTKRVAVSCHNPFNRESECSMGLVCRPSWAHSLPCVRLKAALLSIAQDRREALKKLKEVFVSVCMCVYPQRCYAVVNARG